MLDISNRKVVPLMINVGIGRDFVNSKDYILDLLACQCMPTLLKWKPASLITVDKRRICDMHEFDTILRYYLDQYLCSLMVFQETESRLYLFLYNEHLLWLSMSMGMRQSFLERYGYGIDKNQLGASISQLGNKYRTYWVSGEFPHEIGIFMGYPLADVEGFIRNHGKNYVLCGMWKVYERVKVAEAAFSAFHQIKSRAIALVETKGELLYRCEIEAQDYSQIGWELLSY